LVGHFDGKWSLADKSLDDWKDKRVLARVYEWDCDVLVPKELQRVSGLSA
jgi:hypothetical protein